MAVTANYKVRSVSVTFPPYNKNVGAHNPNATPAQTTIVFDPNDAQIANLDRLTVVLAGDQRPNYKEGQISAVVIPNSA